jgi:copper homeostasis protein (lipoprotein)
MNRVINIGILLLLVLFISFRVNVACNELRSDKSGSEAVQAELPVTFTGLLPCDDCPDIQYTLTLEEERYVEKSFSIEGESAPLQSEGIWELISDTLYLFKENTYPDKRFLWKDDKIILLDQNNTEASSFSIKAEKL